MLYACLVSKLLEQVKRFLFRCLGANSGLSADFKSGLIGAELQSVQQKNDFFIFFNFAPVNREVLPDGKTVVRFKPTGEAFRSLVTLWATLIPGDKIQQLRLEVARNFIEDPKNCMYAADLVKSFLVQAQTSSADRIGSLATEINARTMAQSSTVILTSQPLPPINDPPSVAYTIYRGRDETLTLMNSVGSLQVSLQNITVTGSPNLELTLSAKFK
jgi:hypothetical protein